MAEFCVRSVGLRKFPFGFETFLEMVSYLSQLAMGGPSQLNSYAA